MHYALKWNTYYVGLKLRQKLQLPINGTLFAVFSKTSPIKQLKKASDNVNELRYYCLNSIILFVLI